MKTVKSLVLIGVLAGSMSFSVGCVPTPGYTGNERVQQILRNQNYELLQAVDDFDHFWMLRPVGRMTMWNVQD